MTTGSYYFKPTAQNASASSISPALVAEGRMVRWVCGVALVPAVRRSLILEGGQQTVALCYEFEKEIEDKEMRY
jgi:hypothetical protein